MGSGFSSVSPSEDKASVTPVVLNVYDLTPLNNYLRWLGLGIFHSGIEVHGSEYGFGAHDFPTSGVFEVEPKTCPGFLYRCSILLGHTNMPPSEFRGFIERVASEYHGDTYHLISKNCNHFTDDVSKRLTARPIPQWVNRLAGLGALSSNFKVSPAEDGPESFSVITTTTHELQESDDPDQDKHLLSPSGGEVTIVKEVNR
ncbi:deSI-like protein At4g17486 isoform X2 [Zingiber officinale]|uniref:deSI-like protein At4g17486 isoform X2 n=1 Tax=Zingiber officinale TaxID=94328 RepID=UPI001C4C53D5|nr:deSI-like protein At4g17486 isoform X2 [Zingiber officinale]